MGAWGYGIKQSDFVLDLVGEFDDLLKQGKSAEQATEALKAAHAEELGDPDEGPEFWLAIADRQWTYGRLDPAVVQQIEADLREGRSLNQWSDDPKGLSKRRAAIEAFLARLAVPNPKPKKPPRTVIRPPKFAAGDCLSIQMDDGRFTAALVTVADHSQSEYGKNLIVSLNYVAPDPPSLEVFEARDWLVLTHHWWTGSRASAWYLHVGFQKFKQRITVVGQTAIRPSDPATDSSYAPWTELVDQIRKQQEWDRSAGRLRVGQSLSEVQQVLGAPGVVVKFEPGREVRVFDPLGHFDPPARPGAETIRPTDQWPVVVHLDSPNGRVVRFRSGAVWTESDGSSRVT